MSTTMERRTLERPWGPMRVWEAGDGPAVLALHGLGGSGRYWRGLADRIAERSRLIAPDLAGFGASAKPRDAAYDRPFHVADLDAVVEACVPANEPVIVVGHSLGAMLGLVWSAHRVDRVRAIGSVSTPYPRPGEGWDPEVLRGPRVAAIRGVVAAFRFAWPVVSLPVIATGRYPAPVVRDYGRQTLRARTRSLHALWSDPSLVEELPRIERIGPTTPVLFAHARDDERAPVANVERWRRHLPHAEARILPHGGHQLLLRTGFEPLAGWLRVLPGGPSPGAPTLGR